MDLLALKHLLREVRDFLEEETENRAQAGSTMSDYARQPHKLMERIDMALAALPPKNAPKRTGIIVNRTRVLGGDYLCTVDLEGKPKTRVAIRLPHAYDLGHRVTLLPFGQTWMPTI